jgi:hypothetical protein
LYPVPLFPLLLCFAASSAQVGGLSMGYSQFTAFAVYGLIIFFGGWEVRTGNAKFEDMLKAFLGILMAAIGIGQAQVRASM